MMISKDMIESAIRAVCIQTTAWEGDEDIVLFEGAPIGMTISRHGGPQFDRWWPEFASRMADYIVEYNQQGE